ncbi:hypothetical protein F5Y12DRAFT_718340 [Xylaria sp. FL1777]|nr:hypothetical protein F5Y12DRAFT_718340 [Xylaria sp. FL1777]
MNEMVGPVKHAYEYGICVLMRLENYRFKGHLLSEASTGLSNIFNSDAILKKALEYDPNRIHSILIRSSTSTAESNNAPFQVRSWRTSLSHEVWPALPTTVIALFDRPKILKRWASSTFFRRGAWRCDTDEDEDPNLPSTTNSTQLVIRCAVYYNVAYILISAYLVSHQHPTLDQGLLAALKRKDKFTSVEVRAHEIFMLGEEASARYGVLRCGPDPNYLNLLDYKTLACVRH